MKKFVQMYRRYLNFKFLIPILLTTSLFAQDKNNQISYTIETTTGYYQNISIALVDDASIEVN